MPNRRILILGGTGQARGLAAQLHALGYDVISSLAGVTHAPLLPVGKVRQGGFGGVLGLVAFLRAENISLIIDATHAFATQISANAFAASAQTFIPVVRLSVPIWRPVEGDDWREVHDFDNAVRALPLGARVLLTIGRKEVLPFWLRPDLSGVARMIEAPETLPPSQWKVLLQRPPFSEAAEITLLESEKITHLVTKNAGGMATASKLAAARALKLSVIMIARPQKSEVPTYFSSAALVERVATL